MNQQSIQDMESPQTAISLQIQTKFDDKESRFQGTWLNLDRSSIKNITIKKILISLLCLLVVVFVCYLALRSNPDDYSDYYDWWPGESRIQYKRKKLTDQQKAIRKECYKRKQLHHKVFFIPFDIDSMTEQQITQFKTFNNICQFVILPDIAFDYFADLWNIREMQIRFDQAYIDKNTLTNEQKRILLIFFKLYFWGGIYIHSSLGVNFGKYIKDKYLFDAQCGTQLVFAKSSQRNQNDILLPDKNFLTIKVCKNLSQDIRSIIKKIIAKEDWMKICEKKQCSIINEAIKYPGEF